MVLEHTPSHSSVKMLLILLSFFALALAAPLDPPLDLDTFTNLTETNRCSSSRDWRAYGFLIEDCFTAIQRIYIDEVVRKSPHEVYEFIAEGTYPKTRNPSVRTPSQYIVNSCTLSIVMLDWFGSRVSLPGSGPGAYEQSDTATFRDIYGAARVVEQDCLLPTRRPGWEAVGSRSSIGVFLWATDSSINHQLIGREENPSNSEIPNLISPNVSSNIANNIDSTK